MRSSVLFSPLLFSYAEENCLRVKIHVEFKTISFVVRLYCCIKMLYTDTESIMYTKNFDENIGFDFIRLLYCSSNDELLGIQICVELNIINFAVKLDYCIKCCIQIPNLLSKHIHLIRTSVLILLY